MMEKTNDLKTLRTTLRQMTMKAYTRSEILAKKHLNENDDRFKRITGNLVYF